MHPLSFLSTYKKPGEEGGEKKEKRSRAGKGEGVERKRAELWMKKSEFVEYRESFNPHRLLVRIAD